MAHACRPIHFPWKLPLSHPDHPLADPACLAAHPRWTRIERLVAGLTIVDGVLGLAVWTFTGHAHGALPLLSLLGLLAGVALWRAWSGGQLAALAFYGLQLASYHPFDMSSGYQLRAGLSLGWVIYLPTAVMVVNVFALGMFGASAALLWWRARGGGKLTARTSKS
jgi:hypothetical protein